jgi:hypothetical protein
MAISYVTAASLDGTQNGSAPIYGARAWVNFNGTGTVAIRASGNVSSITDNGTGDYTVNFTTAMADADYSMAGMQIGSSTVNMGGNLVLHGAFSTGPTLKTSTQCRVQTFVNTANSGLGDMQNVSLNFFR